MAIVKTLYDALVEATADLSTTQLMLTGILSLLIVYATWQFLFGQSSKYVGKALPPHVPHSIPVLGNAVAFGLDPVGFLEKQRQKYGDCFTFTMLGRKMTFCLGEQGNHFVFNVPVKEATAEGAYVKLTRPVFGDQVVYDVENSVLMEQKKFVKDALTTAAFTSYVPVITEETLNMANQEWPKTETFQLDAFTNMAELTIRTASSCLMGKEIRDQLHSNVAKLFHDLDRGLTPLNVFVEYLPLPRFINRDRANKELTELFLSIMEKRRQAEAKGERKEDKKFDVLESLMTSKYRDGSQMTDVAVAHMMIALLMAGQHTSSTTASWLLFRLAQNPELQKELLQEQSQVLTGQPDTPPHLLPPLTLPTLKQLTLMDNCMKETLRMHPPIHTVMRLVEKDLEYEGVTIPKGHFLCAGLTVNHYDKNRFDDAHVFNPRRDYGDASGEWTLSGVEMAQKSARNVYLPFGAGRHRCIGEHFAYVQNKTIVATLLREFELQLPMDAQGQPVFPESDFTQLIVLPKANSQLKVIEMMSEEVEPIATNALIVTGLPKEAFTMEPGTCWEKGLVQGIWTLLTPHLNVRQPELIQTLGQDWQESVYIAQLKSLKRALMMFDRTQDAKLWKTLLPLVSSIRTYYGQPVDMTLLRNPELSRQLNSLQVPQPSKNFLLSPPSSPPIGWTQVVEQGPAKGGHADIHSPNTASYFMDRVASELELFQLDQLQESQPINNTVIQSQSCPHHVTLEFKSPNINVALPTIIVEDVEGDNGIERVPIRLPRTAMPPVSR